MLMWIPSPVYERIPQFYFLVGLLLIADGIYLGFDFAPTPYYVGLGLASCAYGLAIRIMRIRYRRDQSAADAVTTDNIAEATDASATAQDLPELSDDVVADEMSGNSATH